MLGKLGGGAGRRSNGKCRHKRLLDPGYKASPERAIVFHVEAWDMNCPQHIRPRFTEEEIAPVIEKLKRQLVMLEEELAALQSVEGNRVAQRNDK